MYHKYANMVLRSQNSTICILSFFSQYCLLSVQFTPKPENSKSHHFYQMVFYYITRYDNICNRSYMNVKKRIRLKAFNFYVFCCITLRKMTQKMVWQNTVSALTVFCQSKLAFFRFKKKQYSIKRKIFMFMKPYCGYIKTIVWK